MGEWEIKSSLEKWSSLMDEIEETLLKAGFSASFVTSMLLAGDEIFANKVMHTYKSCEGVVKIKLTIEEKSASLEFSDYGEKFDPVESIKEPCKDTTKAKDMSVGGLGLFIAKSQVDELKYEYKDKMNIITLTKSEKI